MIENFQNKSTIALEKLSRYFIRIDQDTRILTVTEFMEIIPVSRGTIQNSLKFLKDTGAIDIEARGKLGSFLKEKNLEKLLRYSSINYLVGVMPLPYSMLYEGLASGVLNTLENNLEIPTNLAHMRGAMNRINLVLEERYDFAVVSSYAAQEYLTMYPHTIDIAVELGLGTFVENHILLKRKEITHSNKLRVGMDESSLDQLNLTKKYFEGWDVEYISLNYFQIEELLQKDIIDMAIWNGDELRVDSKIIETQAIDIDAKLDHFKSNTEAVVVTSSGRTEIKKILQDNLIVNEVIEIQNAVVEGKLVPRY